MMNFREKILNKMENLSKKERLRYEKEKEKRNTKVMIWGIIILFIALISFLIIKTNNSSNNENLIYGDDVIEMQFFHLTTCPHCIEQKKFHVTLLERYPNLRINEYEITAPENRQKYLEFAKANNLKNPENIATPTTFIGNRSNIGFGTPETTGKTLISMIEDENNRIAKSWDSNTMKTTSELRKNALTKN